MFNATFSSKFSRSALALAATLGLGVPAMSAQTIAQTTVSTAAAAPAPAVTLSAPGEPLYSSSSAETEGPTTTITQASLVPAVPNFAEFMQYGGRPRGGRPRYRGANTNPDGSSKYLFYGGFGFQQPVGNTYKYFAPDWGLQFGGGRQFNAHFALPIEFDWDEANLSKSALGNQAYIYTGDSAASDNGIDANAHIWSFSIDPRYTFVGGTKDGFGAYALADVGFYHKVTNFTAPQDEEYCSLYGCGIYEVNSNFDHYTSNAPGFGAGVGLTYKFSHFSNERFYAEARYVFVDNSQRSGYTIADAIAGEPYSGSNFFPANSNRTTYFPVKFGLQF
jgi:hypothetical protein